MMDPATGPSRTVVPACAGATAMSRVKAAVPGRVVPACAGNGGFGRAGSCRLRRHPRVCGERGLARPSPSTSAPGHPCVCGEHLRSASDPSTVPGSSLRVRGTSALGVRDPIERVVPGRPCVCGERGGLWIGAAGFSVSSLRIQETETGSRRWLHPVRVIPACAGNSVAWSADVLQLSCHPPPACAENHASVASRASPVSGSSLSCCTVTFSEVIEGVLALVWGHSPNREARFPRFEGCGYRQPFAIWALTWGFASSKR